MGYTQQGIPFVTCSHTSHAGAEHAARKRGVKMRRLLTAYRAAGDRGLIDAEVATATGLPLSSVCSLRNSAKHCGLVAPSGQRPSVYGVPNTVWVLTTAGRVAADAA